VQGRVLAPGSKWETRVKRSIYFKSERCERIRSERSLSGTGDDLQLTIAVHITDSG
jgi:hypothetical protein